MAFNAKRFITEAEDGIRKRLGGEQAIIAVSGGVDSFVAATLAGRAAAGHVHIVYVDNGLMRKDETGKVGPQLGPGRDLPETIVQLAGTMWNHSEAMSQAMRERGLTRPSFDAQEMADLVAFLYSVRSTEPGGSPRLGEVLFAGRGCDRCHGVRAEGTERGTGLRGRGRRFTSISFAAALWRHGSIYGRTRENGQSWPELSEGDVGDLITFLNSSAAVRP